jgi:hypothetical protein
MVASWEDRPRRLTASARSSARPTRLDSLSRVSAASFQVSKATEGLEQVAGLLRTARSSRRTRHGCDARHEEALSSSRPARGAQ